MPIIYAWVDMETEGIADLRDDAQYHAELEVARDEYEDLFASIRSILISVDARGIVRRWSQTSAKTFGIDASAAIGQPFTSLGIKWDWSEVRRACSACEEAGLPARVEELTCESAHDGIKLLGLTISPSRRGGFLIMGADVTYRKVEERLLMERERFYRSIVDNIQDVIFETDAAGHWTFLNPAYERLVGISANEATGRLALDSICPSDRIATGRAFLPVVRGQAPSTRFQVRYGRGDGTLGWAEVHVEAQRSEEGAFLGTFGTIREISERKRNEDLEKRLAEQLLRATEDRVKTIIDSAPLMVFSLNKDSVLTFIDGKALETLGQTSESLEGLNMIEFVKEDYVKDAIRRAIDGEPVRVEIQSGDVFLDVRYSPVFDDEGRPNGATGVAIDTTESKRLENQLVHARKMESIGHLAAGLAHEVNTPAQYIADNTRFVLENFAPLAEMLRFARASLAAQGGNAAAELQKRWMRDDMDYLLDEIPAALSQSLEGLSRVTQIVKSMKSFSHPGTKDRQWSNLNEQIESTLTVSRNEWKYVAALETRFDPNLPLAWCLPAEINQVLLNIIINASHSVADCVAEGKYEQGKISILTRSDGESIEIEITDNAKGIPKEIREKIFDPFFTTKDPGKGTGQGLALAQSVIVEHHLGQIAVESEFGFGTTFIIRIPIGKGDYEPMIQREAA